jgi:tRNA (guanine37-N1)-methyltransferase
MLTVNILTIFPEVFSAYFSASIIGKAQQKGLIKINVVNIRDYANNKHHKVDDTPFGGGAGMVMMPEPLFACIESLQLPRQAKIILTSPQGTVFTQTEAKKLAKEETLTIICGRYEGIDQRVIDTLVTDEYSIGDYVLTGGELPAMVMLDAISRMVKGVVGKEESVINDSFYNGLFDYPHYTRPANFRGLEVPAVLQNGNHKEINKWRATQAIEKMKKKRPDLLIS